VYQYYPIAFAIVCLQEEEIAMKNNEFKYSKLTIDRLQEALDLISEVYHSYNGKEDSEEVKEYFKELINYDWHKNLLEGKLELLEPSDEELDRNEEEGMIFIGSFYVPPDFRMWICEDTETDKIVGVLAMYDEHVYWMFVDGNYHRRGISRCLFNIMLDELKPEKLTVSASLYAVDVYRKFGFVDTDTEQDNHGIKYIPMEYVVKCA